MKRLNNFTIRVDWLLVILYAVLVILGWLNIYASVYDAGLGLSIFNMELNSGKQLMWIGITMVVILLIFLLDLNFFTTFSYIFYGITFLMLIGVLFMPEVNGAKAWFQIGAVKIQPAEFAKFTTALVVAKYMNDYNIKFTSLKDYAVVFGIILLPMAVIMLQPDAGTFLVFCSFFIAFYREGMNPTIIVLGLIAIAIFVLTLLINQLYLIIGTVVCGLLIIGIAARTLKKALTVVAGMGLIVGVIYSVDLIINNVLMPHQQKRIQVLINPNIDPLGDGWNVTQSKIAIGSGGLFGKGFLEGTQTKFDFVPEQSTDFIFCTIGEEHGWLGSLLLIVLFMVLLLRIIYVAERQKYRLARIYGYCVAGILFFHFMINVGMTIGLFPVIGIPLPFFSYGGSSLLSFTILLFIFIKLDAHRMQILTRG
ncbi:rod shape-determining protein RodA [Nafulsella turpanensis]|uniref:rod shape-determining protein RodA n=1 Tax=Nafulsella turpanensis TaxID=1265690 RepID=UPI000346FA75|nr:rod shape-determining protein RodA [Nafulsella turpanensis]